MHSKMYQAPIAKSWREYYMCVYYDEYAALLEIVNAWHCSEFQLHDCDDSPWVLLKWMGMLFGPWLLPGLDLEFVLRIIALINLYLPFLTTCTSPVHLKWCVYRTLLLLLHLLDSCIHCVYAIMDSQRMRCGVTVVIIVLCVCVSVSVYYHAVCYCY